MRKALKLLALVSLVALVGCAIFGHGDDWYTGPSKFKDLVDHYRNKIADCMGWDRLGSYEVQLVPGTRKGNRCWAAYVPSIGMEVCGCAIGGNGHGTITLVYDPNTDREVPDWIVEHEVMEAERTGHGDNSNGHPEQYKHCLDNPAQWRVVGKPTYIRRESINTNTGAITSTRLTILLPD